MTESERETQQFDRETPQKVAQVMPERIGPYEPLSVLGTGGMGVVYRANDLDGSHVAVKVMNRMHAVDPVMQRRFIREAAAGARLYHPNVVRCLDFGADEGHYYIAMELVEGDSLWDLLPYKPSGGAILEIADQILAGLSYAHARGVIHRDIKPENILIDVTRDGVRARLMDFGVAWFRDEGAGERREHVVLGTPEYISPEQSCTPHEVSTQTDLYSFGVLLWEMLCGEPPFLAETPEETMRAHYEQPLPEFRPLPEYTIEGPLPAILQGLLQTNPANRYRFASDVRSGLRRCRITGGVELVDLPLTSRSRGRNAAPLGVRPHPGIYSLADPPFQNVREELDDCLAFAKDCLGRNRLGFIVIEGTSGSGKSRLISELAARLEQDGLMQAWQGSGGESGEFREGLREALRSGYRVEGMRSEYAEGRIRRELEREGVDEPHRVDAFVDMLIGDSSLQGATLAGDGVKFDLVLSALRRGQRLRPVFLGLDDILFQRGDLANILDWVALHELSGVRGVIMLGIKSESSAAGEPEPVGVERLRAIAASDFVLYRHLKPLPLPDVRRIVVASMRVDPKLATAVASESGGNPRVALEHVQTLAERHGVELDTSDISAEEVLEALAEPSAEIARRRVDQIHWGVDPSVGVRALELLALFGHEFQRQDAIEVLLHLEASLDAFGVEDILTSATASGVLHEHQPGEFRFATPGTREVLLNGLKDYGNYKSLARRLAVLEVSRIQVPSSGRFGAVASRFELAEHWASAQRYYIKAGRLALSEGRLGRASGFLKEALNLDRHVDAEDSRERRYQIILTLARVSLTSNDLDEAGSLVGTLDPSLLPKGSSLLAQYWRVRAELRRLVGDIEESTPLYERALKAAVLAGDRIGESRSRWSYAGLLLQLGRIDEAEVQVRGAISSASDDDDADFHGTCLTSLGFVALYAGAWAEARQFASSSERLLGPEATRRALGGVAMLLGELELRLGNSDAAIKHLDRAHQLFRIAGDERHVARAQLYRGRAFFEAGAPEVAKEALSKSVALAEGQKNDQYLVVALLVLARVELELDNVTNAARQMQRAIEIDRRRPIHSVPFAEELVLTARMLTRVSALSDAAVLLKIARRKLVGIGERSFLYKDVDEVELMLDYVGGAEPNTDSG